MSNDNGGPAFPREDYQTDNAGGQTGMTLRDYFAAKAMQADITRVGYYLNDHMLTAAKNAYKMADDMLVARSAK